MARSLNPGQLVARIAEPSGGLSKVLRRKLVIAISNELGVARHSMDDRTVFAILSSVLEADEPEAPDFLPTFIRGQLQSDRKLRKVRCTDRVVRALQCEARVFIRPRPRKLRGCIPVHDDSTALIRLGGDIDQEADFVTSTTTDEGVWIRWYTPGNVPIGGIIFLVREDYTVVLYQRLAADAWVRVVLDGTADVVNLVTVLQHMAGPGKWFTSTRKVSGETPLIRPLPENYAPGMAK